MPSKNSSLDGRSAPSTLQTKNIRINGRRTSVRLEPEMWRSLKHIAGQEDCSIHDIATEISRAKHPRTSMTAAIRVFVMSYYRAAATKTGHQHAGHLEQGPKVVNSVFSSITAG
jgi:predicted DNA-binding ribbon-helix-helix protein